MQGFAFPHDSAFQTIYQLREAYGRSYLRRTAAGNRSQAGDWLIFRPFEGRKMCLSPCGRRGQSHFRGVRRENRDSPRERLPAAETLRGDGRVDPRKDDSSQAGSTILKIGP